MGVYVVHQPQRPVDASRRIHGQRILGVKYISGLSISYTFLIRLSCSYRSYRGYNYDAAYTSHAHGWSSGPTSALTFYVLGITVTSPQGLTWTFDPHTSGLEAAEGGFETPLGWFGAKWSWEADGRKFTASLDVPKGTSGKVRVPGKGIVSVNGKRVTKDAEGFVQVPGGNHIISVG